MPAYATAHRCTGRRTVDSRERRAGPDYRPGVVLIGLTGGIGSGKSTVSALLAERGALVIDADAITRELQQPGTDVFAAMRARFGDGIVAADGTLDRQAVADIVFTDALALKDLGAIVHPAVGLEIAARLEAAAEPTRWWCLMSPCSWSPGATT